MTVYIKFLITVDAVGLGYQITSFLPFNFKCIAVKSVMGTVTGSSSSPEVHGVSINFGADFDVVMAILVEFGSLRQAIPIPVCACLPIYMAPNITSTTIVSGFGVNQAVKLSDTCAVATIPETLAYQSSTQSIKILTTASNTKYSITFIGMFFALTMQ